MLIPDFKHWNKVSSKRPFGDLKRNYGANLEKMPSSTKPTPIRRGRNDPYTMGQLRYKWAEMDHQDRITGLIKLGLLLLGIVVAILIIANFHTILDYLMYPPGFRPGDDVLTPVN